MVIRAANRGTEKRGEFVKGEMKRQTEVGKEGGRMGDAFRRGKPEKVFFFF